MTLTHLNLSPSRHPCPPPPQSKLRGDAPGSHHVLSAWARVDVELAFLAEMAMSGSLRPNIGRMPISYELGVVPFGLVLSVSFRWSHFGWSGRHSACQDVSPKTKVSDLGPLFGM